MRITKYYSTKYGIKTRSNRSITAIILHYTGMQSERESFKRLISPKTKVSCHYLINRKGKVLHLVEDKNEAWHAGKSMWGKYKNLNKNSIGIELVNKGHKFGYQAFSKKQINILVKLCKNLKRKYKIKDKFILGHSDIAPLRKVDPGEKFPWDYLSYKGIGHYPIKLKKNKIEKKALSQSLFYKNLQRIGYRYLNTKFKKKIIKSFQRRYRQNKVDGILDSETFKISEILSKKSNIA
tara:strand:- start:138 stop:848 length:711 start_codon:yes stop_codon:yes gene_type:complete